MIFLSVVALNYGKETQKKQYFSEGILQYIRLLLQINTRCTRGWVGPHGRSGRVRKISPPTGIRSPNRPARSESLYRLLKHRQGNEIGFD